MGMLREGFGGAYLEALEEVAKVKIAAAMRLLSKEPAEL